MLEAKFLSRRRVRSDLTLGSRVREPHSDLIRVHRSSIAEFKGDPIRVVAVSKCILAEPDALGDGSADSIYLGDKIVSRSGRTTGHPGRSKRHVVHLGFGNSRRGRSWSGQIKSGPGRGAAEFSENTVKVVSVVKRDFAELDALSDGSADAIYLYE